MVPDSNDLGQLLLTRHDVLRALARDSNTKRELVEELDIPRSTLDDIVRELDDAELVKYTDGRWATTIVGQCMTQVSERYLETLDGLTEMESLSDTLDAAGPLDCDFLVGADIHHSDTALPDKVMHVLLEKAAAATRFRIFTPSAISAYVEPFYEQVTTGENSSIEVTVPPVLFEELHMHHSDVMNEAIDDSSISFYTAPVPVSFGLWIADDANTGIIIFGEGGIRSILVNDSSEALAWAKDQYEQVKRDADAVLSHNSSSLVTDSQ